LLFGDRLHLLLGQLIKDLRVIPEVDLGADNQAGHTRAVVADLWEPLLPHVLKGSRGCDAEANEEHVGLGVRQWPQAVVVFLTSSIEQAQRIRLITDPETKCCLATQRLSEMKARRVRSGVGVIREGVDVHNSNSIVIEDRRNVFRGELVRRVTDEKTCFTDRTVTNYHTPVKMAQLV